MGRSIVIGISGSIAAYKSCDLVRNLVKKGIPVSVVMSKNAVRFVGPVTFQALTDRPVIHDQWDEGMLHIDLKNEAALFAVIPASADVIGKMANGIADDALTSAYLAMQCPVLVAPAMNPNMYNSRPVQRNMNMLKEDGVELLDPQEGLVVCGDEGKGKMASVEVMEQRLTEIYFAEQNRHTNKGPVHG